MLDGSAGLLEAFRGDAIGLRIEMLDGLVEGHDRHPGIDEVRVRLGPTKHFGCIVESSRPRLA